MRCSDHCTACGITVYPAPGEAYTRCYQVQQAYVREPIQERKVNHRSWLLLVALYAIYVFAVMR